MNQPVVDVRRLLAGLRVARVGNDGDHAAAETQQPSVNDVDAPATAGLCRSVGHEPLVAPLAGFQRGGDTHDFLYPLARGSGDGHRAGSPPSDRATVKPDMFREGRNGTLWRAVE